jgi:hypothetical protein
MKKIFPVIFFVLIIISGCTKKQEVKLEAFSPEAFAYGLGDSSEVDATVRVKGFQQNENNGWYSATLSYDVDLVTTKGDTIKSIISKVMDKKQKDKIADIPLEIQFDLDSTYVKGNYKLIFRIKDVLSGKTVKSSTGFNIDG